MTYQLIILKLLEIIFIARRRMEKETFIGQSKRRGAVISCNWIMLKMGMMKTITQNFILAPVKKMYNDNRQLYIQIFYCKEKAFS